MKIKEGFVVRQAAGSYVVIKQGGEADLRRMVTINESGALIWDCIAEGLTEGEIARKITDEYDIDLETAKKDVAIFIARMKEADVLE